MKKATFFALAVLLVAAIVVRFRLGRTTTPEAPPIVKDEPRPKPKPQPAPSPSPSVKVVDGWIEDPESFAWPKPPPPRKNEVHEVDATHLMVDRGFLETALEDQAKMVGSARIVPDTAGGVKIFGLRKGSFFDVLGLRNGDRVESMNGLPLIEPDKALDAYAHVKRAERVFVTLTRAGAPLIIHYLITSAP